MLVVAVVPMLAWDFGVIRILNCVIPLVAVRVLLLSVIAVVVAPVGLVVEP